MTKHLQANSEQIVQVISSIFNSSDVQLYMITTKGNLMFVNVNIGTNKIVNVEPLYLGDY